MASRELAALLKSKRISLFCFPAKTTGLLQPLEVRMFRDGKHFKCMLALGPSPGLTAAGCSVSLTGGGSR